VDKRDVTAREILYDDLPEWHKALRAIVVAGELGVPSQGLALVARKALRDEGVPYPTQEEIARGF
jgi:hypothetical protein